MPKPLKPAKVGVRAFRVLTTTMCHELVREHHYSGRMPSSISLCFGEVDYGPPKRTLACCIFSWATGRRESKLWELTRLVRLPEYQVPLTKLISKSLGYIRERRLIDLVVSFADAEEDHHGGIYQASSWIYDGIRNRRLDGFNVDGKFLPARTCNAIYGTSSVNQLPIVLRANEVQPHFDLGKHCYWKPLTKRGMQQAILIGLRSQSYPKPMVSRSSSDNVDMPRDYLRKGKVPLMLKERQSTAVPRRLDIGKTISE